METLNYSVPVLEAWQYESVGVICGPIALLTLYTFFNCRDILWTPSAVPEIGIILGDLCIAGLHPFAGAAAIKGWWIFGSGGCQVYAISGFLFGNFLLTCVGFVAFDRYILECRPSFRHFRTFGNYSKIFIVIFIDAAFWAVAPALGWGKYKNTPVKISCTIDWMTPDLSMVTYNIMFTLIVGVLPVIVGAVCYIRIYQTYNKHHRPIHWVREGWEGKIILGCLFVPLLCYGAYVLVVFWGIIGDPKDIPAEVNILPPVVAKFGGFLNPVFYMIGNKKLFHCVKKTLGFNYDKALMVKDEIEEPLKADIEIATHATQCPTTRTIQEA